MAESKRDIKRKELLKKLQIEDLLDLEGDIIGRLTFHDEKQLAQPKIICLKVRRVYKE